MPKLIMVGGFLGAGKTTLLWEAAKKITEQGKSVGLITNDQAPELVDTVFLQQGKFPVAELSGSCFCCNYSGFMEAIEAIKQGNEPDFIFAEPVGSCTDLSATILQPMKYQYGKSLPIGPFTVLADPCRLKALIEDRNSELHESAGYILRKQLEEADIIAINKIDLLSPAEAEALKKYAAESWPRADIYTISAKSGEGIADWFEAVLEKSGGGGHLAEVDYDIYAEGEGVLGWLNAVFVLKSTAPVHWKALLTTLMKHYSIVFQARNAAIGHVKALLQAQGSLIISNITGSPGTLSIRGEELVGKTARLILNARVQMDHELLSAIALDGLAQVCGNQVSFSPVTVKSLRPGRPNPTYRYERVVSVI